MRPPRPSDRDHRLRVVLGQPAPAAIAEDFMRRFDVKVLEYYGMTEIGLVTLMPWDGFRPGSCGVAVSEFFDLRIVDPATDEDVEPGQSGELVVRPREPWAFNQGYWRMPDRTAEAVRNIWYHTGDALRRDQDGYYHFTDRIRDVIRRRAVNISSYDVERVIADHPAVAECAAVAVPLEVAGGEDEIKLCLVLQGQDPFSPGEFLSWCEERMPYFAVPRYRDPARAAADAHQQDPEARASDLRSNRCHVGPSGRRVPAAGRNQEGRVARAAPRSRASGARTGPR
jgi:crotonobetaine/carnitine-CoA ligase